MVSYNKAPIFQKNNKKNKKKQNKKHAHWQLDTKLVIYYGKLYFDGRKLNFLRLFESFTVF